MFFNPFKMPGLSWSFLGLKLFSFKIFTFHVSLFFLLACFIIFSAHNLQRDFFRWYAEHSLANYDYDSNGDAVCGRHICVPGDRSIDKMRKTETCSSYE